MDLINDQQGHSLDIAPGLPASTDPVPLLGRGHYQVSIGHSSHVRGDVSCQLNNSTIEKVNSLSQQPYNRKCSRSTQHSSDDAVNIYNITNYTWTYTYNLFLYKLTFFPVFALSWLSNPPFFLLPRLSMELYTQPKEHSKHSPKFQTVQKPLKIMNKDWYNHHFFSHLCFRVFPEHSKYSHLSSDRFPGPCGSPQQYVGVRVIKDMEDLGLYGVKVGELVQGLQGGVIIGRLREGGQIQ